MMMTAPEDLDDLARTALENWQPLTAGMFRAAADDLRNGDESAAACRLLAIAAHSPHVYLRSEGLDIAAEIVGVPAAVAAVVEDIGLDLDEVQEACRQRQSSYTGEDWFVGLAALADADVISTDAMERIGARQAAA